VISVKEQFEIELRKAKKELQDLDLGLGDRLESGIGKSGAGIQLLDMDLARRERVLARIEALQEALNRVSKGNYGRCESCGAKIDPERLDILPTTTLCVLCAEAVAARGESAAG
jgi:RNA polymerase-binding transcription factor DksA